MKKQKEKSEKRLNKSNKERSGGVPDLSCFLLRLFEFSGWMLKNHIPNFCRIPVGIASLCTMMDMVL